jgi:sec-independent protein translocase protein TatC
MASSGEEEHPEFEHYGEEEGGPVKSFLDHLEDLRWVLIKIVVGVALGMLVCLIAANWVLAVVKWPLERADRYRIPSGQRLALLIETNVIANVALATNVFGDVGLSNRAHSTFQLVPKLVGNDYVVTLQPVTNQAVLAATSSRGTVLRNLSPVGGFWVAFQVALYGGIVLTAPYIIYVLGQFIVPALKYKEKKYVLRGFVIGTGLFLTGVAFCYFALMPMALRASFQYSEWLGFSADEWRAEDYISFVCKFMLGMGLGFELPVVVLTLVKIGVVDHAKLKALRRYMIVVNLVLGALLTTPEVVTQVLMFIPLQGLYELSVWIAGYWEKNEQQKKRARMHLFITIAVAVLAFLGLLWKFHPGFHAWATRLFQ